MKSSEFPHQIIKEVVHLYQKFYQLLNIKSPVIRATGISFFYKCYQKSHSNPPEYAITAISCFHIATKLCEIPISFKRYINEIKSSTKSKITSSFVNIFRTLDGIPPENTPDFKDVLLQKLIRKEIEIIIQLEFDFSVQIPYDISTSIIEQILKWHINKDDPNFILLCDELIRKCWNLLNDLQVNEMFYTNSPELIAISSIELTFLLSELPLISPINSPWYTFIIPDIDFEKSKKLTSDIKKFFMPLFINLRRNNTFKLKTQIDINLFKRWIRFPLIPRMKIPICEPPSLEILDSIVSGDDSFKNYDCDHVPQFPPPDFTAAKRNNLQFD